MSVPERNNVHTPLSLKKEQNEKNIPVKKIPVIRVVPRGRSVGVDLDNGGFPRLNFMVVKSPIPKLYTYDSCVLISKVSSYMETIDYIVKKEVSCYKPRRFVI